MNKKLLTKFGHEKQAHRKWEQTGELGGVSRRCPNMDG